MPLMLCCQDFVPHSVMCETKQIFQIAYALFNFVAYAISILIALLHGVNTFCLPAAVGENGAAAACECGYI